MEELDLLQLAGGGRHRVAKVGQQQHRDAAHPAAGAGDQHRAGSGIEPHVHQLFHTQPGGESGGAEQHGLAWRHACRAAHHPGGRHADVLGKATWAVHSQIVAGDDHLIARLELTGSTLHHLAGSVDAGGMRIRAGHPATAGGGQRVLVVERGVAHTNEHLARRQLGKLTLDDGLVE
ncbi:hypothetical protein D3C78_1412820 [compost metagenome]